MLNYSFKSLKCEQVTRSAPVAHCPSANGVVVLSRSWRRSGCLRVTSRQLTGVRGRRRQLCSSDHAQVSLLSQWEVTGCGPRGTAVTWVGWAELQTASLLLNLTLHWSPPQPATHPPPRAGRHTTQRSILGGENTNKIWLVPHYVTWTQSVWVRVRITSYVNKMLINYAC